MNLWFLEIHLVHEVCAWVSVSAPKLIITSGVCGVIWSSYDYLSKFYSFCMAAIIGIVSSHGLRFEACCRNQPNKSKLAVYKPLLHFYSHLKQLYISNKMEHFSYKCGFDVHGRTCIEAFNRTGLGYR